MKKLLYVASFVFIMVTFINPASACHQYLCTKSDCSDKMVVCRVELNSYVVWCKQVLTTDSTYTCNKTNVIPCNPCPTCGDKECNGDETCSTCPQDCGDCISKCGDDKCDENEDCKTCELDCGKCVCDQCPECKVYPFCGDRKCNGLETCSNCELDCGTCPLPPETCGNGKCDNDETCESCEPDCGLCPIPARLIQGPAQDLVGGGGCSMGSPGSSGLAILFVLGFFVMISRKIITASLISLILIGMSLTSYAQAPPANTLNLAPTTLDYYSTQRPETLGHLNFELQFLFNYAHNPLRIIDRASGDTLSTVIRFRQNMDVALALGIFNRFELAFVSPILLGQGGRDLGPLKYAGTRGNFDRADFGDFRLIPKIHVFNIGDKDIEFNLGLAVPITLSTGDRSQLLGENGPTITPTLLVGLNTKYFSLGLNTGVRFRHNQNFAYQDQSIDFSDQFVYGTGLAIPLVENYGSLRNLSLIGDIWGAVGFGETNKEEVPLEALGGLRANLKYNITINVAAGGGITKGYGVPEYRILWGVSWSYDHVEKVCPNCKPVMVEKVKVVEKVRIERKTLVLPHVYFDTDKFNLRPDALVTLNRVVDLLKENSWVEKIRLEGHCDHRASDKHNNELSRRRVMAVAYYLVSHGVKFKQLNPRFYGETQRVDNTNTTTGMQKNRRVEFHILKIK